MLTEFFDRIVRALAPRPAPRHPATPETAKPPVLAGQFFKTPSPSLNSLSSAFSHPSSTNSAPHLPTPSPFASSTTGPQHTLPNHRVILPGYSLLNTFASYGSGDSPFLVHPGLFNNTRPISGLPPPSFAFGPAKDPKTMGEPKQSAVSAAKQSAARQSAVCAAEQSAAKQPTAPSSTTTPTPATAASPPASTAPPSTAVPPTAKSDGEKESSVPEIPYFKLHAAHLSALRGHIKYLELLNRKKGCEGKLDKMIAEYAKIVKDAKTAAATAGIVREDSQPPEKRKSRPSVSFADEVETHESPVYKKTKSKPASTANLKRRRGNAGKRKPTAEAQATLRSLLGKRNRSSTETSEEDEEMPQKPFKRPRIRIFQEGDPLGKYVGDPDSDDEDSDSDSFKSATSKSEPTPAGGNTTEAASPSAATPPSNTKAKATFSPSTRTASTTSGATSPKAIPIVPGPTPRASQTKHTANDNPGASKSPKKQKQASASASASSSSSSSSADCLFAIRPPLPGKHAVDDEAGSEKSAKKQKQKSTPAASVSDNKTNASSSTSTPMAPPIITQSPAKRSGGANSSQPNTKRNKKDSEN